MSADLFTYAERKIATACCPHGDGPEHPAHDPRKPWHPCWRVRMWAEKVSFQLHCQARADEDGEELPAYARFKGKPLERELQAHMDAHGIDPFATYPELIAFAQDSLF